MPDTSRISPTVAAAWGLTERTKRGPKPNLQLSDIVDSAIEIADAEGLATVSMARVARALGYTTMSLYRYVESKDELLMHMQDAAQGIPDRERSAGAGWREGLEVWALTALEQQLEHPWFVEIPVSGPPLMPRGIDWMDWAMDILSATPLAPIEKISALLLVNGYVRNEVAMTLSLERGRQARGGAPDEEDREFLEGMRALITADSHPSLASLLEEGFFAGESGAEVVDGDTFMFRFGLDRILDGIERLIAERSAD